LNKIVGKIYLSLIDMLWCNVVLLQWTAERDGLQ